MSFHEYAPRGDVHGIHYWTYPTYAARDSHLPSEGPERALNSTDVVHKRICVVLEDFSFHALFGVSPALWLPLCGAGYGRFSVPIDVVVRDLICTTGDFTGVRADNAIPGLAPVVGAVVAKASDTIALVAYHGSISGYSGFTAGADLFLGNEGGIIEPPLPTAVGTVIQKIGQALSATVLLFDPDQPVVL